ncbi:MAG: ComE operon protein 1 [Verrucomicrobiota bacterium]
MRPLHLLRIFLFLILGLTARAQVDLVKLAGLRLVPSQSNDADSFVVSDGAKDYHLRLYLVDAPETAAADTALARRVREQTRYFGVPDPAVVVRFGALAAARTRELLTAPFTAYTANAGALGRSADQRIYAYVVTSEGKDLGELLVREGLARAFGQGRANYANIPQAEQRSKLADLELSAALARKGIWAESQPELIAAQRAAERADTAELATISREAASPQPPVASQKTARADSSVPPSALIDLNTATSAQLDTLPGIGPALAKRIIAARPFASVDDLERVSGLGAPAIARLRPLIAIHSGVNPGVK